MGQLERLLPEEQEERFRLAKCTSIGKSSVHLEFDLLLLLKQRRT